MELQIPYSILFIFSCFFLLIWWSAYSSKKSTKNLPPGPWRLPLIGNIHQFIGPHPHHTLRDMAKKYGPIIHLQLGETTNIVVSSPEIVKEIFKTHDAIVSNRPPQLASDILSYDRSDLIFSSYGSKWRQLRKICTLELLTAKQVQSFRHIREEEVSALLKKISESEGSVINLTKEIFSLTNGITARAAFGKKSRDQEKFLECLEEMVKLCEGFSIGDLYPSIKVLQMISGYRSKIQTTQRKLDRILENIVWDHKERNDKKYEEVHDLVDVLLRIQQQNNLEFPLTHNSIKAVILNIFSAGTETSSTSTDWVLSELIKNPKVMQEAQSEVRRVYDSKGFVDESELHQLKYLKSVIKETWRLHPPAPLLVPRENSERCVINGYEIPAKSRIIINFWSIARDPKYWEDEPDKFKPERFLDNPIDYKGTNYEYIPFGAGRRICPGITFATPNVELPVASLLYHFDWKLPEGMKHEELDMTEAFGAAVKRKTNLYLIPTRYRR